MTHAILNDPRLVHLLDLLLPGGDGFPAASEIGLAARIANEARLASSVASLLEVLPREIGQSELEAAEATAPTVFGTALVAAYSAYYTHPAVLAVVEAATGYRAEPPQPAGYALPPFDPAMLAVPSARGPQWRDPRPAAAQSETRSET